MASLTHDSHDAKLPTEYHDDITTQKISVHAHAGQEAGATGRDFTVDDSALPDGYFRSKYFLGSMLAIGLSLSCGVAGFSFIAPLLGFVNADIGPSPYLTWVALTYTLTGAVGFMVVGRLTDIFGRRWFFIIGSCIALLGSIVCATAPNIPAMIAGETLIGLGSSAQLSFVFAASELVPMKHRFLANGYCYLWLIFPNCFGPPMAYAFQYQTKIGWRGMFYVLIAMNFLCVACWYLFYFPPNFEQKHGAGRKKQFVKDFDYVGTLLFALGLLLFLMGLSWGGSLHPWKSAHVLSTIIIGILLLIGFFVYEVYVPLKEPLLPMSIAKNWGWACNILIWSIGASVYYAFAIIWPNMVAALYGEGHGHMWAGWASSVIGAGITLGTILGGSFPKHMHWGIRGCFFGGSVLLAAMATCTPETPVRAIILLLLGTTLIGINECLSSTCAGLCIEDQRELGAALGIGASSRSFVSTLAGTAYTVVLTNQLSTKIPEQVTPALVAAGLPVGQVATFLTAFPTGNFSSVADLTPEILAAGKHAYKYASADSYRMVFYATIAFMGVGIILTFFVPNLNAKLTGEVTVTLHGAGQAEDVIGSTLKKNDVEKHESVEVEKSG